MTDTGLDFDKLKIAIYGMLQHSTICSPLLTDTCGTWRPMEVRGRSTAFAGDVHSGYTMLCRGHPLSFFRMWTCHGCPWEVSFVSRSNLNMMGALWYMTLTNSFIENEICILGVVWIFYSHSWRKYQVPYGKNFSLLSRLDNINVLHLKFTVWSSNLSQTIHVIAL